MRQDARKKLLMLGKFGYCNNKNIRSGGTYEAKWMQEIERHRGGRESSILKQDERKKLLRDMPSPTFHPPSQVFTSFLLTTSNYVINFSNHLHGVGWGGLLMSFLLTTSKYFTNFSNHLHGVGWGKATCNYIVIFFFKLQLRYGMTLYMTDLRFSMCRLQPLRIPQ